MGRYDKAATVSTTTKGRGDGDDRARIAEAGRRGENRANKIGCATTMMRGRAQFDRQNTASTSTFFPSTPTPSQFLEMELSMEFSPLFMRRCP